MLGKSGKSILTRSADCRSMIINLKTPVMANAYAAAHESSRILTCICQILTGVEGAVRGSDISLG